MLKKLILPIAALLTGCGVQSTPSTPEGNSTGVVTSADTSVFHYDPSTGEVTPVNESVKPQGYSMTGCLFYIDNAHMSTDVPGAVKVNGRGTCPTSSDTYTLSVTMILEKCNDNQGYVCYQYKTGKTTPRTMTSTRGGSWGTGDINSFTTCNISSYYRGRLRFQATNAQGVSMAVPLVDPVGNVRYVTCPANP